MPNQEQQRQRELLNAVNSVATVLLASEKAEDFKHSIHMGMELMGRCVDVDFIEIWQNIEKDGNIEAHLLHKWQGDLVSERYSSIPVFSYKDTNNWYERFINGEIINGPVSYLSKDDQDFLEPFNIKSTVIIPLFIQREGREADNEFWGIACIDDCRIERNFSKDELDILRSASLMMVNAINRNVQANEHLKMLNELMLRDNLLYLVNSVSAMMFTAVTKEDFDISLIGSLDLMGRCVDADRIQIWQNIDVDGELHFILKYQWLSDLGQTKRSPPGNYIFPYKDFPDWENKFSKCEYINSTYANLSPEEQSLLEPFDIKYLLIFPLFVHEQFWGFFSLDDCHAERGFQGEELDILRSGSLIMVNAINQNLMMAELEKQDELLKAALNQAQTANNAKSSFLARMSHEMRTPLNAVIGLSELSLLEADELGDEVQLNLEKIHSAGATLLSTVNDILDISKIEAGKFELEQIEYDTPSLINDAVTQSIMRIDEKPIKFVLEIDEMLPSRLFGDDLRIKQVLNNLLSNAFKYTKEGIVELGIKYNKESDNTCLLTIYVKDSGVGIKEDDLDSLFSDYAMMDTKTNRKIEGTGLGLPITKHIAEMMGGSITVESEYGKGSKFTVILPQILVDAPVIGKEVVNSLKNLRYIDQKRRLRFSINKLKLSNVKVLVVDDVATNLDVARGMLKSYGITADCLSNGYDAVAAIKAEKIKYNAIFMDHMMPGMDGIETVRIIREEIGSEYAKTVPIIALTANAIVGNEEMFLQKGFQAFIAKPIELFRLDEVIKEFLGDFAEEVDSHNENITSFKDYKIEGLDITGGIKRFRGNINSYMDILKTYAGSTRELLESINTVEKIDIKNYEIIVHGIKGSSNSIGAAFVGSLAEKLELEAEKGNIDFIRTHNDEFIFETEKLIKDIEEMLKKSDESSSKTVLKSPSMDLLKKLYNSCENYDMDGIDSAIAEIVKYEYEVDRELSSWLKENAAIANFTEIAERIKSFGI